MRWVWKSAFGIAVGVLAWSSASATPPGDNIAVQGNAPEVCSLGDWQKISGPGSFLPGQHAINTYSNSDMVDASAESTLGSGQAIDLHAPLICNTAITWSITTEKGAFRLDSGATPPAGFANQWLYQLLSGPYKTGGGAVASLELSVADGTPFSGETHTISTPQALQIAYFGLQFTPSPQSARMLAGTYSEEITLTVQPTL